MLISKEKIKTVCLNIKKGNFIELKFPRIFEIRHLTFEIQKRSLKCTGFSPV